MASVSAQHFSTPCWTEREAELLAVTLRLLQQRGYDRLTVESVATEAKASKATMYRRWPSKAELVCAAVVEGTRTEMVRPQSGSLREDLLEIGALIRDRARQHAGTMRAVLTETSCIPQLSAALNDGFVHQHESLMTQVLGQAVDRGEIDPAAISSEIRDLLPGYLAFRFLMPGRPATAETIRALVDDVLMPSLSRTRVS